MSRTGRLLELLIALQAQPRFTVAELAAPPKLFDGLGNLSHPVSTRNPLAQSYYEQGLRCFHSYVTPAAGQAFQRAANLDPSCAMAYWGLSLAPSGGIKALDAANRALELAQKHGTDRERRFWNSATRTGIGESRSISSTWFAPRGSSPRSW